jgi:hypothetical protein
LDEKQNFYPEKARKAVIKEADNPLNKARGITEGTGLLILDGIYILIQKIYDLEGLISKKMDKAEHDQDTTGKSDNL